MAKKKTPTKKSEKESARLIAAFKSGNLSSNELGAFFEMVVQYRGYYIDKRKTKWASDDWRNDQMAAVADTFPYAQQGFETGIRMRQTEN